jgi:hypothetical protein
MQAEEFGTAMAAMADLRAPIDAFFETVQINTENQVVRRNRLNLLGQIRRICLSVADLAPGRGLATTPFFFSANTHVPALVLALPAEADSRTCQHFLARRRP